MEERIRKAVEDALTELGAPGVSFAVERPGDASHGDYATNAAMAAAKMLKKNPKELADVLAERLQKTLGADAEKVGCAGAGFVNITLSTGAVRTLTKEATEKSWGTETTRKGKRIIVEYSNPNAFKEMHIGHLMSTIIGESVARLIQNTGATIARDTYGGDVGPHVAKALWALQKKGITEPTSAKEIGEAYTHGSRAYEESEDAKKEIDELNQKIYEGSDTALMELWRKGRDVSMEAFGRIWKALGTHFDYFFFDSEAAVVGVDVVKDGLAKGIFEESDGAVIYRGEKVGLHTRVFLTSRGTPLYEAKDMGLAFIKEERFPSDESIILTAAEQSDYFKVILAALGELAPLLAAKTKHIPHGFLRLTTGKMSSREGTIISATELLEDVVKRAGEKNPDPVIAEQVAVGAVKYMILRQSPGQDIIFDPEKSLSLEGDSGPYLQYALVRARKILSYASEGGQNEIPEMPYAIERIILHYPEVVAHAEHELAPQHITQYLTELAGAWNAFYAQEQVLGSVEEAYKQNVARAFANTMEHGLSLLGIPTPERM